MLLFLTNLALQSVFCFVVYWILGASTGEAKKNIYSERTVQELVEWRRSIAHDANIYKRATLHSMAQRVCDGDAGLERADVDGADSAVILPNRVIDALNQLQAVKQFVTYLLLFVTFVFRCEMLTDDYFTS